jgi:hypothetical protein
VRAERRGGDEAVTLPNPLNCQECGGCGRTDNHVTGEVECSGCSGAGIVCMRCGGEVAVEELSPRVFDQEPRFLVTCQEPDCDFAMNLPADQLFQVDPRTATPKPLVFHPMPIPCRGCGTILQATYAEENGFACPHCRRPACYTCGCTEDRACSIEIQGEPLACSWSLPGLCSFCAWRFAYEVYQEATGRPADDPFYMSLGRTARAFHSLGRLTP